MKCRICEDTGWEDLIPQPVRCDACDFWEDPDEINYPEIEVSPLNY